jgi:signal transduction histidine kinase
MDRGVPPSPKTAEARARKLAREKSYLQLAIQLMSRVGGSVGLDDTIGGVLSGLLENIGGTDALLYYFADDQIHCVETFGDRRTIAVIDDRQVAEVIASRRPIVVETPVDKALLGPPFTAAWLWVVPLLVGDEVVGAIRLTNMPISFQTLDYVLPTLFGYVALTLKNAITNHAQLKEAYAGLQQAHDALARENEARRLAELQLREVNGSLEGQVAERTRELQATIDTLSRANAELERFAYVASHDLQEPVRTVVSFSQLLERRLGSQAEAEIREYLDFIIAGARRMGTLIHDLLEYSRAGNRQTAPGPVCLAEVLSAACDNLHALIEDRQAKLEAADLPTVKGDSMQLIELFQNLIANAIKFTHGDARPTVRIDAQPDGNFWLLSIADNGIGIEPEYFDRIFVIFQRLHNCETYPGTGVGLALCKRIVERHGGRIWVESQPGEGSVFRFTLPTFDAEAGQQLRSG